MKLLRAKFSNFRLLRDVELTFTVDDERKLTVIRAANETGKTTCLHGLQWALYGDVALPDGGKGFRIHPIDWDTSEGRSVPIRVSVDYEVTTHRHSSSGLVETTREYRLVRTTTESIQGSRWSRSPSEVKLFEKTGKGTVPVEQPESEIKDQLPKELREVFFTDGDRALSFIEADASLSTKRARVQRAIRSLLGLEVLENAAKHVHSAAGDVNKKAQKVGRTDRLNEVSNRLTEIDQQLETELATERDATEQIENLDVKIQELDQKVSAALQRGDREKLDKDQKDTKNQLEKLGEQSKRAAQSHSAMFRGLPLARDLLAPVIAPAVVRLQAMQDQGQIPSATIPVLEHRLENGVCICGEPLAGSSPDSNRRRQHIEHLISQTQQADAVRRIATEVYYGTRTFELDSFGQWRSDFESVESQRTQLEELSRSTGRRLRGLEAQIDDLPDVDIAGLRDTLRQQRRLRDKQMDRKSTASTLMSGLRREQGERKQEQDRLLRSEDKGKRVLAELEVTRDLELVLNRVIERVTTEELKNVSTKMNDIFLEMIGADNDQGTLIRSAEISSDFDILVFGPHGRRLDPDRDLNGASRRALTFAFILALTRVSGVVAPNIIDTPLGMMSGYVKSSVLRTAIRESSQLILFLTPDEIRGCETTIDNLAGEIYTLTNTAHYPKMLAHRPSTLGQSVVRCECNHRETCEVCERIDNDWSDNDAEVLANA